MFRYQLLWTLELVVLGVIRISAPPVATFDGKSYISMAVRNQVSFGDLELIHMKIKTRISNAFLFSTGIPSDRIGVILYLMNGFLNMQMRIQNTLYPHKTSFRTPVGINGRLDDNRWHFINFTWQNPRVMLNIDGKLVYQESLPTKLKLSTKNLFLGGAPRSEIKRVERDMSIREPLANFTGCMEKPIYRINNININLIRSASKMKLVKMRGNIHINKCIDHFIEDPVSFLRSGASLRVPEGWQSPKEGNLSLRFRTTEPDGLILYQRGNGTNPDFLALELRSGELFLLIDAGSGTRHFNVIQEVKGPRSCSDGMEHTFKLNFFNRSVEFSLDGSSTKNNFHLNKPDVNLRIPPFREINLRPEIYLGSLPSKGIIPPREVWSAVVRQGFVGCISALTIDDRMVDLVYYAQIQSPINVSTNISLCQRPPTVRCQRGAFATEPPSCRNGGVCREGWNRLICDCSMTNYTGNKCDNPATVLSFDGTQWMKINLPREVQSETEHVQLRFKTSRKNGLLFTSYSRLSSEKDRFELKIEDGYLVVIFNFGKDNDRKKITKPRVSDGHWHLVKIRRRALIVEVAVDGQTKLEETRYELNNAGGKLLDVSTYQLARTRVASKIYDAGVADYFIGHMMHFVFNGINYFELAHTKSPASIEVTADFSNARDAIREFPVTFKTAHSYLTLPCLQIYNDFRIELAFKTTQAGGVILYNDARKGNRRGDFILLELASGNLHLSFDVGAGELRYTSSKGNLNDGLWHQVSVARRPGIINRLEFRVDEMLIERKMTPIDIKKEQSINFNLNQRLHLGGVHPDSYTAESGIVSKMGFQGCLASLSLNRAHNQITNAFTEGKISKEYASDIVQGCAGSGARCTPKSCHYNGHCVQQWTRTRCNCEMTSFVGEYCSEVSSAVEFGPPKGGTVMVEYAARKRNTKRDELAFGMQTTRKGVTIFNVVGEGSWPSGFDYIIMDIKRRGIIQVEYFTGRYIQKVIEPKVYVADGRYHIVRFVRDGADALLKIDNSTVHYKNKRPGSTMHFNRQRWIFLGGQDPNFFKGRRRRPRRSVRHLRRPLYRLRDRYRGVIAGFVFNGLPVTDLVVGRTTRPSIRVTTHDNVTILKDFKPRLDNFPPPDPVILNPQPPGEGHNPMLSTTSELSPSTTDSKIEGLVKAKPDCPKYNGGSLLCIDRKAGPDDRRLVLPNVRVTLPTTTTASTIRTEAPNPVLIIPVPRDDRVREPQREREPDRSKDWERRRSSDEPTVVQDGSGTTGRGDASTAGDGSLNLWLIVAISCGGLVFLVLIICLIYRCRRRDEGSYSVESNQRDFGGDPACKPLRDRTSFMNGAAGSEPAADGVIVGAGVTATPLNNRNGAGSSGPFGSGAGSGKRKKGRRKETKEWYV